MFQITGYKKIIDEILRDIPDRSRNILSRRFGIGENQELPSQETLESIGDDYGITRERVRQIEKKSIDTLRNSPKFSRLREPLLEIKYFIDDNGGLKKEDLLESYLVPDVGYRPYLVLLLDLGKYFSYKYDTPDFYSFWETKKEAEEIARRIDSLLIELLEKKKKLLKQEEILEVGRERARKALRKDFKKGHILSYIEVSKIIESNPFGEYGLFCWPEVNPKGVREKAYLILKKEGKPVHFRELARIIESDLQSSVHVNTLHNELIKDPEFVLVGRGVYALRDWGYKEGTVRDIIKELLKREGELSRGDLIEKVKEQRLVKESTIALNLQYFKKTREGNYAL